MAACVVVLSGLFARNIYFMSSLFLGLTISSIPFIVMAERKALQNPLRHGWFALLGMGILLALEGMKKTMEQRANPACAMGKGERMV